jgi:glycosyltransferase-like protein
VNRPSVALFTYSTLPRGSVVHTAYLADALHDLGCETTVYALDKERRGFYRPLRARLRLVPASPTPTSTAELVRVRAIELAEYLERTRPLHDIHHAEECLTANGLLTRRSHGADLDIVRTVHHVEAFADPFLEDCQRRSIRDADLCLAVSRAARDDVAKHFGVHAASVSNGVDFDRFSRVDADRVASLRRRLGGARVILAVGGVEERKNTLGTLRAFVRVRERHPDLRLWILGGATVLDHGSYRAEFDRTLASFPPDVRAAISELGVVADDDVPALFQAASALAFPSLHEGFGLAALEALAAGLPVVASNRAPLTEFLDDECATLVDPCSDDDIARGLLGALETGGDRGARLRDATRRSAGAERARSHSWSRAAIMHLEHYAHQKCAHVQRAPTRRKHPPCLKCISPFAGPTARSIAVTPPLSSFGTTSK